jgi:hypothetical protein
LELFFQLLNQRRKLLLPFGFDLLPERLFHSSTLLYIARLKQGALLRVQAEARIADRRLGFTPDSFTAKILSLAQDVALCGTHPQPTLGVTLEILAGRRGK